MKIFLNLLFVCLAVIPASSSALQHTSNRIRSIFSRELLSPHARRALTSSTLSPSASAAKPSSSTKPFFSLEDGKAAQKAYYAKLEALPWGKLAKHWIPRLHEEDQKYHQEFLKLTGSTEKDWQEALEAADGDAQAIRNNVIKLAAERPETAGHITGMTRDTLDTVLKQCCIDPSQIDAVWADPKLYGRKWYLSKHELSVDTSNTIAVSPWVLSKKNHTFLEYGLSHEAMHIMHNDGIHKVAQAVIHEKRGLLEKVSPGCYRYNPFVFRKFQALSNKHSRLYEQRADILAMLLNPTYAQQGYIDYRNPALIGAVSLGGTHPAHHKRALYHKNLHNQMTDRKPWYASWPSTIVKGN